MLSKMRQSIDGAILATSRLSRRLARRAGH